VVVSASVVALARFGYRVLAAGRFYTWTYSSGTNPSAPGGSLIHPPFKRDSEHRNGDLSGDPRRWLADAATPGPVDCRWLSS
jgi:hypothetical protein